MTFTSTITDGKFSELIPMKCMEKTTVAECTKCHSEIKGNASSSSNFLSHLKRIYGVEMVREYEQHAFGKKGTFCEIIHNPL